MIARDSFTCGVCFQILNDPVCCANESCNYMLCKEHLTAEMRCPNRCNQDEILKTVKVQRVIVNQLMSLEVHCHLCQDIYEIGEREAHFKKYCREVIFSNCIFQDCKQFVPSKREEFERHILESCGSKQKQCETCELDIYKIYHDDDFRAKAKGHVCRRDCLVLFLESVIENGDAAVSLTTENSSHNIGLEPSTEP
jgi:hypothetical protein